MRTTLCLAAVLSWTLPSLAAPPAGDDGGEADLVIDPDVDDEDDDDADLVIDPDVDDGDDDDDALTLEPELAVSDTVLDTWIAEGVALFADEQFLEAALRFERATNAGDETHPKVSEALYHLGAALYELGLYQSALIRFEPIVAEGPSHPKYRKTLGYLLRIARDTGADPAVVLNISEFPPEVYPPELADELHFLVGQFYFHENQLTNALTRFQEVSDRTPDFYVRAKFLEGVTHVAESGLGTDAKTVKAERLVQGAEAFKTILRYKRDEGSSDVIDKVAERAMLALGRLFYSTRQYKTAVRYYDQIPGGSLQWLGALYEVSWVHYQNKNYPRALGNLHTLNSPYFEDQYFPESRVLQALILFYNCQYDEADAVVKAFVNDYYPLMSKLKEQVNQFADPNAFYFWLASLTRSEDTEFSTRFKRIFNAALEDKKLRRKFDTVSKLNVEDQRLKALLEKQPDNALLQGLQGDLLAYKTLVIGEAGDLAQARLLRVLKDLKRHLAGALKIKGETLKARRGDSSDSVRQEQAAAAAADVEIVVDSEHIEWPFTGEYWRDELGSYLYDIDSRCNLDADAGGAP